MHFFAQQQQQLSHVHSLELERLTASQSQESLRVRRGVLAAGHGTFKQLVQVVHFAKFQLALHQLHRYVNARQIIIEVVRDARSEMRQSLHFLKLVQAFV